MKRKGLHRRLRGIGRGIEHTLAVLNDFWLVRHPRVTILANLVIYPLFMVLAAPWLESSVNFIVILPVLTAALMSGLLCGTLAGALGLPANLLVLALSGNLAYAPKSWVAAELSGIILGLILGYLSDFFHRVERESARRRASGMALVASLREREALLDELDHRVRNNLSLIRSLMRLQARRKPDRDFILLVENLDRRIMAIARVYDLMQVPKRQARVEAGSFLSKLLEHIGQSHDPASQLERCLVIPGPLPQLDLRTATALGLLVNEAVSNAWSHGRGRDGKLVLSVMLENLSGRGMLTIRDGGPGFDPEATRSGLGLDLIALQTAALGGSHRFMTENGTVLIVEFGWPV